MLLSSIKGEYVLDDAFIIVIKNKKIIPRLIVPINTPISKEIAGNIHTMTKATPTLIAKNKDNANKTTIIIAIKNFIIDPSSSLIDLSARPAIILQLHKKVCDAYPTYLLITFASTR
jgi:hypothetical protein